MNFQKFSTLRVNVINLYGILNLLPDVHVVKTAHKVK